MNVELKIEIPESVAEQLVEMGRGSYSDGLVSLATSHAKAMKALGIAENRFVVMYRSISPHANTDTGNNFADKDETVILLRALLKEKPQTASIKSVEAVNALRDLLSASEPDETGAVCTTDLEAAQMRTRALLYEIDNPA